MRWDALNPWSPLLEKGGEGGFLDARCMLRRQKSASVPFILAKRELFQRGKQPATHASIHSSCNANRAFLLWRSPVLWSGLGHTATIPPIPRPGSLAPFVRSLALPVKIVLFLLMLGFAALNSGTVTLRYFLGLEWRAPLSLVILMVFAIGLLTGLLACSMRLLRSHRELRGLKKELNRE
jgi:lipopolysaccharide assembly protein A